ncbi:hypothetical protein C9426_23340 [Serratia sp. S1B]|nr:hypothetical protein C9426_23340 [Serratia sp. S1B]
MNNKFWHICVEILVNFVLPWLAYRTFHSQGEVIGLLASTVPPLLWSIIGLIRFRRLDALSMLVLAGILLSFVAMLFGGDPRMLLMRESLVSGLIGVAFAASFWLRKPLLYYLARATVGRERTDGSTHFEEWYARPEGRRAIRTMTLVWGVGLMGETLLKFWLVQNWPVQRFLLLSPFVSYGAVGLLALWTLLYRRRLRK